MKTCELLCSLHLGAMTGYTAFPNNLDCLQVEIYPIYYLKIMCTIVYITEENNAKTNSC